MFPCGRITILEFGKLITQKFREWQVIYHWGIVLIAKRLRKLKLPWHFEGLIRPL